MLLLRPNIALYSTDALPVNCSAHHTCSTSKSRSNERVNQRTCSCLTQTLLCHGCGSPVGYMIVVPVSISAKQVFFSQQNQCEMCTASSSVDNRTTNNHRFVFHCGVVCAYERLYLPEEPYNLDVLVPLQSSEPTDLHAVWGGTIVQRERDILSDPLPMNATLSRSYLPTPPPDELVSLPSASAVSTPSLDAQVPALLDQSISSPLVVRIPSRTSTMNIDYFARSASGSLNHINPGDVLYWHHLTRHGEIPACCDNSKARGAVA